MANADLDIPEMITQLHELQRVSRETYSVQKELIDYNDNLNTTSFMSAPGYGGMPRTGPSPRVQSMASMQIAQQVSKPMGPLMQNGQFVFQGESWARKFEQLPFMHHLRTEVRATRHLIEPLLMGGKVGIGTARGALHMATNWMPQVTALLGPMAIGGIVASMITELVRNRVEKQIKTTETYTELTKMITEKFKYDPQVVNRFAETWRKLPTTSFRRQIAKGGSGSDLPFMQGKPEYEEVAPYQVTRGRRTETELNELSKKYGEEIDKRRKYAVKYFGYEKVFAKALQMTGKKPAELNGGDLQLAADTLLGERLGPEMKMGPGGVQEEYLKWYDNAFTEQYQAQIETEARLKGIEERLKFDAANKKSEMMIQQNQMKLDEALKQQYALEDSNWTEI